MRTFRAWLTLAVILSVAGCAEMPFGPQPRDITLSADRVAEALGKRLGIDKKMLDLFQVKIEKPKVTLDPQTQRLRADLEVTVAHPFSTRPLSGRAGISGGIAYDAKSLTVSLLEPRIERFEIDGVPQALKDPISRLGAVVGGELLPSYPIVTLRPQDLRVGGHDYEVKGFEVLQDAIKVMLTPRR